jgi:hypothetical protein
MEGAAISRCDTNRNTGNNSANYQHATVLGDGSGDVLGQGRVRTKAMHCKTEPTIHTIPERMTVFLRPILSAT